MAELSGGEVVCGALAGVWRYPVKSMRGEPLKQAALEERGLGGDRLYALRDGETGKIASAKRPHLWGALLACGAALLHEETGKVAISLPDGQRVIAGSDEADAALSESLGRRVTLIAEPPASAEIERYWPDIAGLDQRDVVTSGVIAGCAPGTFFDFAPIHLLTTATLDHLRGLYPEGHITQSRFRPNFVIETGDASGWVENAWVGRTLLIGEEARLRIISPTPRCIVPTLPQPDAPRDLGVLRAIAAHNRPPIPLLEGRTQPSLGVYALIERGGVIRRGDTVRLARDA